MAKRLRLNTTFWVGAVLCVLGVGVLLFLFSQRPKETKASQATWLQESWSGGGNSPFFREESKDKYWTKDDTVDDREGITLKFKKHQSKESSNSPNKPAGKENESGSGAENGGDRDGTQTERLVKGSLISSVLDSQRLVSVLNGRMEGSFSSAAGNGAHLYLQSGDLSKETTKEGEINISDIRWGKWVSVKEVAKGSLTGRFLRYRVDLEMIRGSENSPRVTRVIVSYKLFSQTKIEIDPAQSQVTAESPVLIGTSSNIVIQLKNGSGEVVVVPEEWLEVEVSGLSGCRVTQLRLGADQGVEKKSNSIYKASVVSKIPGVAKIQVIVTSGGKGTGSSLRTSLEESGGTVANLNQIILNDQPKIEFVDHTKGDQYVSEGYISSLIFDAGSEVKWSKLNYEANSPEGTAVEVGVRVGNDPNTLGKFQKVSAGHHLGLRGRYFQYHVTLTTRNNSVTPVFKKIIVSYSSLRKGGKEIPTPLNQQYNSSSVDPARSRVTATTPHRAGIERSQVIITLKDNNNVPIKDFPAARFVLSTEPKFGTIFYDQAKRTDSDGRIIYQCTSTTVSRKVLTVKIKDELGKEILTLHDHPIIDFVDVNDKDVYLKSGELNSLIYDAGGIVGWNKISWIADVPKGTTMRVMVLFGNDREFIQKNNWDLSLWREVKNGQNLRLKARYFQYKILFNNDNPYLTPVLKEIKVNYQNLES